MYLNLLVKSKDYQSNRNLSYWNMNIGTKINTPIKVKRGQSPDKLGFGMDVSDAILGQVLVHTVEECPQ